MKQYTTMTEEIQVVGTKGCFRGGIPALFLLFTMGCATVPPAPPDAISYQERPQAVSAAVSRGQARNQGSDAGRVEALVELLKRKNVISADEAAQFLKEFGAPDKPVRLAASAPESYEKDQIERIKASIIGDLNQGIQEQVKLQVQDGIPREINNLGLTGTAPEWMKRVRFGGDVRLRYQNDRFDSGNSGGQGQPLKPTEPMNTQIDQDRFRYRVRVGATVKVNEEMEATLRLATGSTSNPVSTNTTFGDYTNKDSVTLDLAYLKWLPTQFFTLYGGRMPNPWFSSDLVWDRDLNFEGFALNVKKPVTESWTPFLTVGAFPLQQYDFSQSGKWLAAGQLGLERKEMKGLSAKVALAYYDFKNITGVINPTGTHVTDWTAPLYLQKGNTYFNIDTSGGVKLALASEFRELNLTGNLDIGFWDPVHIVLLGDYVKNLGFDRDDVFQRANSLREDVTGYQIGLAVGYPAISEFGQWKINLNYKYLGGDAVVDAFTDSDFRLGGTNSRGWILGGDFGLAHNFWISARWLTANDISSGTTPFAVDVLQVDLNSRF